MKKLLITAMLCMGLTALVSCGGGGGGSSTPTTLGTDTTTDIETAYTALETDERAAFRTILLNSDDSDVQDVMEGITAATAGGFDSAEIQDVYTDSTGRANTYTAGSPEYLLYEALANALAALREVNAEAYAAFVTLITGLDDEELGAIADVFNDAGTLGYTVFSTLLASEIDEIVADVPPASDEDSGVAGVVADPYIMGAVFCVDENENGDCDEGEPLSTASDENGAFTFEETPADGAMIVMQTAGMHNGVPYAFDGLMGVYEGGEILVTPLTTLYASGLTADQIAEMFETAGLQGVTAENVMINPMEDLIGSDSAIDADSLAVLRSSLAAYMLMRVLDGSDRLSELTAFEVYTSAMTQNDPVNAILFEMSMMLNEALSENTLALIQTSMAMVSAYGLPDIEFDDVVATAVAIADKLATIGYTGCNNSLSVTDAGKVEDALDGVVDFITSTTDVQTLIENLGPAFYLARIRNTYTVQEQAQMHTALGGINADWQAAFDCESGSFVVEDDGSISCYAE